MPPTAKRPVLDRAGMQAALTAQYRREAARASAQKMIPKLGAGQASAIEGEICLSLSLPAAALSPNSRACWQAKAKAIKAARQEAATLAWIHLHDIPESYHGCPWPAATIEATFYKRTAARADKDNALASCKAAIDGLADAGIVSNDSAFTFLPVVILKDKDNPRLELLIKRKTTEPSDAN